MTDKPQYPKSLFLPPEAFAGYNKYLNIFGTDHVCDGEDYVEYVRADLEDPRDIRIRELEERLEVSHVYQYDPLTTEIVKRKATPQEKQYGCDGIYWRDETIRQLQEQLKNVGSNPLDYVKPKPLVWHKEGSILFSDGLFTSYGIYQHRNGHYILDMGEESAVGSSAEELQDVANNHFHKALKEMF